MGDLGDRTSTQGQAHPGLGPLGGVILAFQLYVWTRWVSGPNFERVPAGPTEPPTFMKAILFTWTGVIMVGLPVAIWWFIIRPWRRERRITLDGMLFVSCGLLWFQDPLLNYFSTWSTYNTWMWNMGSWVQDVPGWVSFGQPGAMMAEPVLMNAPGYFFVLLCTMLGCWVMRVAKKRFPNINTFGLIGVVIAWTFFFDFVIEGLFLMPMGLFTYPGAIQALSVNAGTYYQWPLYEGLMWGGVQAGLCCMRYFTDDRGRTFVERGLDNVRGGFVTPAVHALPGDLRGLQRVLLRLLQPPGPVLRNAPGSVARRHPEAVVLPHGHLRFGDGPALPRPGAADALDELGLHQSRRPTWCFPTASSCR